MIDCAVSDHIKNKSKKLVTVNNGWGQVPVTVKMTNTVQQTRESSVDEVDTDFDKNSCSTDVKVETKYNRLSEE